MKHFYVANAKDFQPIHYRAAYPWLVIEATEPVYHHTRKEGQKAVPLGDPVCRVVDCYAAQGAALSRANELSDAARGIGLGSLIAAMHYPYCKD